MTELIPGSNDVQSFDSFYKDILENISSGVYFVDRRRKIHFWNKAAEKITGFSKDQAEGGYCYNNLLMHIDHKGTALCKNGCPLVKSIKTGMHVEDEIYLHHADGHRVPITVKVDPIYGKDGRIVGAVEIFEENRGISTTLKWLTELENGISQDPLTGVFNRQYGELIFRTCLENLTPHNPTLGCLFLDIDNFKGVNDTYGHDIGDRVLKMIAGTLKNNLRGEDVICRWGGEEFVVLLVNVDQDEMVHIAQKLRMLVENSSLLVDEMPLSATISIGAALLDAGETMDSLVKKADELMYISKRTGKNRVTTNKV